MGHRHPPHLPLDTDLHKTCLEICLKSPKAVGRQQHRGQHCTGRVGPIPTQPASTYTPKCPNGLSENSLAPKQSCLPQSSKNPQHNRGAASMQEALAILPRCHCRKRRETPPLGEQLSPQYSFGDSGPPSPCKRSQVT